MTSTDDKQAIWDNICVDLELVYDQLNQSKQGPLDQLRAVMAEIEQTKQHQPVAVKVEWMELLQKAQDMVKDVREREAIARKQRLDARFEQFRCKRS